MASRVPATADTFPKLLIRNARSFGNRPAMRVMFITGFAAVALNAGVGKGRPLGTGRFDANR